METSKPGINPTTSGAPLGPWFPASLLTTDPQLRGKVKDFLNPGVWTLVSLCSWSSVDHLFYSSDSRQGKLVELELNIFQTRHRRANKTNCPRSHCEKVGPHPPEPDWRKLLRRGGPQGWKRMSCP